jgi:hypothetical protein
MGGSEKPLKPGSDLVLHEVPNVRQGGANWPTSETFRCSLIEKVDKGEAGIHVQVGADLAVAHLQPGDYCARCERAGVSCFSPQEVVPSICDIEPRALKRSGGCSQHAVLVPLVQFPQLPAQVGVRPLPAVIRLQALSEWPPRGTPGISRLLPFQREPVETMGNCTASLPFRLRSRQGEHQMIESGSRFLGARRGEEADHIGEPINILNHEHEPPPCLPCLIAERQKGACMAPLTAS